MVLSNLIKLLGLIQMLISLDERFIDMAIAKRPRGDCCKNCSESGALLLYGDRVIDVLVSEVLDGPALEVSQCTRYNILIGKRTESSGRRRLENWSKGRHAIERQ